MKYLLFIFCSVLIVVSCKKDKVSYEPTFVTIETPAHFPEMFVPEDNPFTIEGIELGRYLFYEELLSGDNTQSCATCHAPSLAFSDSTQFSTGIAGIQGTRNAMPLFNMGWQDFYFWDGRAKTLEIQLLEPIPNPIEMHQSWKKTVSKLNEKEVYRNRFLKAFGSPGIDPSRVTKALAQFIRTLISAGSKYDVMYKFQNNLNLSNGEQQLLAQVTPEEWGGYDLFKSLNGADCFHCHNGPLMQVKKYSNNGLDAVLSDLGRGAITGSSNDNGKFKVPSLRNIQLTAPYMHDGRFKTIEEVVNHYSTGIQQSATIDPLIEFAFQGGVQLDAQEKSLLIAFLKTLTDYNFINNPKFQDPE
jgi:cytochrome c peroxidase